jgi:hypothetical protein
MTGETLEYGENILENTYHDFLVAEPGDERFGDMRGGPAQWNAEDEVPEYCR